MKQTTIQMLNRNESHSALFVSWLCPNFHLVFRRPCRDASFSRTDSLLPSRGVQNNSCQSAMYPYVCYEAKATREQIDRPRNSTAVLATLYLTSGYEFIN